jgi:hypothetical protein
MLSALKPCLVCMKLFGLCSFKLSHPLESHGYAYYIWSFVVMSGPVIGVLSHRLSSILLIFYIIIGFVYLLMSISVIINEKKLIQILNDVHIFDQRTGFINSAKSNNTSVKVCAFWILYGAVKFAIRVSSGFEVGAVAVMMIVYHSDIIMMSLLSTVYEQITLRYGFIFTKLLLYTNSDTKDINQFLESVRILYFSLGHIVCSTNQYSGFWIFFSVFNRHLHIFLKLIFIFNLSFMSMSLKTMILLIPDEFIQIIYLTTAADLLQNQVSIKPQTLSVTK